MGSRKAVATGVSLALTFASCAGSPFDSGPPREHKLLLTSTSYAVPLLAAVLTAGEAGELPACPADPSGYAPFRSEQLVPVRRGSRAAKVCVRDSNKKAFETAPFDLPSDPEGSSTLVWHDPGGITAGTFAQGSFGLKSEKDLVFEFSPVLLEAKARGGPSTFDLWLRPADEQQNEGFKIDHPVTFLVKFEAWKKPTVLAFATWTPDPQSPVFARRPITVELPQPIAAGRYTISLQTFARNFPQPIAASLDVRN